MKFSQTIITAVCLFSLGIGSSIAEVNQFLFPEKFNFVITIKILGIIFLFLVKYIIG